MFVRVVYMDKQNGAATDVENKAGYGCVLVSQMQISDFGLGILIFSLKHGQSSAVSEQSLCYREI